MKVKIACIFISLALSACGGDSSSDSSSRSGIEACVSEVSSYGNKGTVTSRCPYATNVGFLDTSGQTTVLVVSANSKVNFTLPAPMVMYAACQVPKQPVIKPISESSGRGMYDAYCI